MTEHYTTNTESVTRWCGTCSRPTQHSVTAGRVGRCMEHESPQLTRAQQKRAEEKSRPKSGDLFGEKNK